MSNNKTQIVQNRDNDLLLPWGNDRFVFGHVDEVNGAGAEEIAGFIPTRDELLQIVKYWHGRILDDNWFYFAYGQSGSTEIRRGPFANRRIRRVEAAIGEEAVNKAIEEVRNKFKAAVDARLWEIFENGDSEQWEATQEEIWRGIQDERAMEAKPFPQRPDVAEEPGLGDAPAPAEDIP